MVSARVGLPLSVQRALQGRAHHAEILTWVMLRRAMQTVGDVARREVFDRIEGQADRSRSAGPTGGPIETVTYDLKKLSVEKIRTIRAILAEAVDPAPVP